MRLVLFCGLLLLVDALSLLRPQWLERPDAWLPFFQDRALVITVTLGLALVLGFS